MQAILLVVGRANLKFHFFKNRLWIRTKCIICELLSLLFFLFVFTLDFLTLNFHCYFCFKMKGEKNCVITSCKNSHVDRETKKWNEFQIISQHCLHEFVIKSLFWETINVMWLQLLECQFKVQCIAPQTQNKLFFGFWLNFDMEQSGEYRAKNFGVSYICVEQMSLIEMV